MGLDENLSSRVVELRKATGRMMEENYDRLEKHINEASFPLWIVDEFRKIKINGLTIKDFGSAALTQVEAGAIIFELAKRDGSIASFFVVHNSIGMSVVDELGDEE
jgi:alkylation response protein AidB-like acyl-CoA dehydrogenase